MTELSRSDAEALDRDDPLASMRDEFVIDAGGPIYLDGHSLGRLPRRVAARLDHMVQEEWGRDLVTGWDRWVTWPLEVGDRLGAALLGVAPGQVAVCDSTTVNLFKVASAVLASRRGALVTDRGNFPTDRYVFEGLAGAAEVELRYFDVDFDHGPDPAEVGRAAEGAALVCLSLVDFRSGALAALREITEAVHRAGALICWDVSHAVGAVEIALDEVDADLAVGCTYKYVNAGPGSPAFVYVNQRLQAELRQPIWGWFGQAEMFVMGPEYAPLTGMGQYLTGTPSILGLAAVDEALSVLDQEGIAALRAKSEALVDFGLSAARRLLAGTGVRLAGPLEATGRGSHLTFRVERAADVGVALAAEGVLGDVRPPDLLRFGLSPGYTRFVDVWDALDRLHQLLGSG